ncbi:hypothetical protein ABT369_28210 [Dactylosporangium sp. NPDC000244]|uniref:hypothetical protein n=1 Tax=Dactylosporangium sp. NPDC000244 TaxID=3154365 RepID=UPI0033176A76
MSRNHERIGKLARGLAYLCGTGAFAALTHRFDTDDAITVVIAVGTLAAIFGFLPRAIGAVLREQLNKRLDERFAQLRDELGEDVTTALRHAVELGVYDGALRRSLERREGEPPRPRRLHSVPRNREGA